MEAAMRRFGPVCLFLVLAGLLVTAVIAFPPRADAKQDAIDARVKKFLDEHRYGWVQGVAQEHALCGPDGG